MRMVLHALPDDIGHFIKTAIIHFLHGMQDAALHGFQSIFNSRHGPFKYYIDWHNQETSFVLAATPLSVWMNLLFCFCHFILTANVHISVCSLIEYSQYMIISI